MYSSLIDGLLSVNWLDCQGEIRSLLHIGGKHIVSGVKRSFWVSLVATMSWDYKVDGKHTTKNPIKPG